MRCDQETGFRRGLLTLVGVMDLSKALGSGVFAYCVLFNAIAVHDVLAAAPPLAELQRNAQQGNLDAQYILAMQYLKRDGVAADAAAALPWLRKSADGGHLRAEYQLGLLYRDGVAVGKDVELALRWLRLAAGAGLMEAQTAYDELTQAQLTREFEQLRVAAQGGDAAAQYALGRRYLTGQAPLAADSAQALLWLTRAAEQQHADAQFEVGMVYKLGKGVPRDVARTQLWLGKAAAQGHIKAKVVLQDMLREAAGTVADVQKSFKFSETLPVYRAAMDGDASAQFELGLLFIRGEAVRKDFTRGLAWLRRAAEQEHVGAQRELADMSLQGVELPQDAATAFQWYQRAALHGDAQAQYMLGNLYRAGSGVHQNFTESRRWYAAAAKQGHVKAQERLGADR